MTSDRKIVKRYPINNTDYKGTISFSTFQEPSADIKSIAGDLFTNFESRLSKAVGANELSTADRIAERNAAASSLTKGIESDVGSSRKKARVPTGNKVTLFLPQGVQIRDAVSYDQFDLGPLGAATEAAVAGGDNIVRAAGDALVGSLNSVVKGLFTEAKGSAAKLATVRAAQNILPENIAGGVRSATKVSVNPNTRALFRQVPLREFSFTFQLVPTSREEVAAIKDIILFFRRELYPRHIKIGDIAAGYEFPNTFDINMSYGERENVYTKILPSYLRDFTATYNTQQAGFYSDGNFTDVNITLSFTEAYTLDRDKIAKEGF